MVKDMRSSMSLFVARLGPASGKEGRFEMSIGDMDTSWFMVSVQQVEDKKLRDREEYKSKIVKTGNESR